MDALARKRGGVFLIQTRLMTAQECAQGFAWGTWGPCEIRTRGEVVNRSGSLSLHRARGSLKGPREPTKWLTLTRVAAIARLLDLDFMLILWPPPVPRPASDLRDTSS